MTPARRPTFAVSVYDVTAPDLIAVARAAEGAGFDALWLGEHVVQPGSHRSEHPSHHGSDAQADTHYPRIVTSNTRLLDPLVALAAVAGATERIRLGTAVYLMPLRHPLLTARAVATVAAVAPDRFRMGVGVGWLEEEFEALGVPFAGRGARHEEAVAVVRAALAGGPFTHLGDHFSIGTVQVVADRVDVPIIMGGNSATALRRAARLADGWFASGNPTRDEAVSLVQELESLCQAAGRAEPLCCHVRVPAFDPDVVPSYLEAGLTNLVFWAQDICPPGAEPGPAFAEAARRLGISKPIRSP